MLKFQAPDFQSKLSEGDTPLSCADSATCISFDVTEKIRIQKELELERSRLIQVSEMSSLGEMAGGIAHEINNPLAMIRGYTLRLRPRFFESDLSIADCALKTTEDILRAVDRTNKIIRGLRNFSRDATIESEVSDEKRQVLIRSFYDHAKERVIIQVVDHGMGFRNEPGQRYFEPFFSTKEPGKGTGLGLSIFCGLIKKHNGSISISSYQNPTIVEIELPGWAMYHFYEESLGAKQLYWKARAHRR